MKSRNIVPGSVPASASVFTPIEPGPLGLLLCRDLIFTTKVKGTAAALGYQILVASDLPLAKSLIETSRPQVVFIDLTAGELAAPSALSAYRKLASRGTCFVGFGPHVDADMLAAAKAAGCQLVLTRSKFAAELPELLRRSFEPPTSEDG
jgi:hypothetical protein